jgi:hypothetical protein
MSDHVRRSNGCWSSTAFVIFEMFTAVPKYCIPLKQPCTRECIFTLSLFHQLESFSNFFARLKTKLNVRSSLHHYELSERSARYKILNTTEHEWQERSDWPRTGNTTEESAYMDKLKLYSYVIPNVQNIPSPRIYLPDLVKANLVSNPGEPKGLGLKITEKNNENT